MTKQVRILLFVACVLYLPAKSQTLEWATVFAQHPRTVPDNIIPNSVVSVSGKITTFREADTLRLIQTDDNGSLTAEYDSQKACGRHTPLILTENHGVALVYGNESQQDSCVFLETDSLLNPVREFVLDFSAFEPAFVVHHLIIHNGNLYLTLFSNSQHRLLRIESNNTFTQIYSGSIPNTSGEEYLILDNGNFVFSFAGGAQQTVRCVSPTGGAILWEQSVSQGATLQIRYKTVNAGNRVYAVSHERSWVNGDIHDFIGFTALDANNGNILWQTQFVPDDHCLSEIDDFVYNPVDDRLYLNYTRCYEQHSVSMVKINPNSQQIFVQHGAALGFDDQFGLGQTAHLHVRADGQLVLLYRSYKNDTEKGNLYVSLLDTAMNPTNVLEINLNPPGSSEAQVQAIPYGNSKLLVTGYIPDPDPGIGWNKLNYFTAMLFLGELLPVGIPQMLPERVEVFPNPTSQLLNIRVSGDETYDVRLSDLSGKIVFQKRGVQQNFVLDMGGYADAVYDLSLTGSQQTIHRRVVLAK